MSGLMKTTKPTEAAGCRYNVQGQLVCGADAVRGAPKAASADCWAVNARTPADVTLHAGVANQGERLYGAVCQRDSDCGPFLSCQAAEMTPQRFCVGRHQPLSLPVAPAMQVKVPANAVPPASLNQKK